MNFMLPVLGIAFAAFLIWSAGMFTGGWESESWRVGEKSAQTGEEQQKVTIAAEQNVIAKQQKAETITLLRRRLRRTNAPGRSRRRICLLGKPHAPLGLLITG